MSSPSVEHLQSPAAQICNSPRSFGPSRVVLGRTQFVGSKFGIFGGFGWVRSSIWVDEPGFRRVRSSVFPNLVLGLTYIWPNKFEVWTICRGSKGFKVRFWWTSLGSKEFEVRPVKFEAVPPNTRSDLCLLLIYNNHQYKYLLLHCFPFFRALYETLILRKPSWFGV